MVTWDPSETFELFVCSMMRARESCSSMPRMRSSVAAWRLRASSYSAFSERSPRERAYSSCSAISRRRTVLRCSSSLVSSSNFSRERYVFSSAIIDMQGVRIVSCTVLKAMEGWRKAKLHVLIRTRRARYIFRRHLLPSLITHQYPLRDVLRAHAASPLFGVLGFVIPQPVEEGRHRRRCAGKRRRRALL